MTSRCIITFENIDIYLFRSGQTMKNQEVDSQEVKRYRTGQEFEQATDAVNAKES